jgi:TolB-like protein/DNA-binding winged helix-turn-helix (wHTH) protein/Tfp pilus assembly protein PilF
MTGRNKKTGAHVIVHNVKIDFERNTACGPNGETRIEPKLAHLLKTLVENADNVVSRHELIDSVWDSAHGADQSLTNAISQLRKVLGEGEGEQTIETVPKRGYRLVAALTIVDDESSGPDRDTQSAFEGENVSVEGKKLTPIVLLGIFALAAIAIFIFISMPKTNADASLENPLDIADISAIDPASIAVLPFVNISPDPNQVYFSDGISEEILNTLVGVEGLKVASRTSAFTFRDTGAMRVPEIAELLRVRYVLEGSVRRSGETIRVTAQLIDAQTDQHLWSKTFDNTLTAENIFSIQDEIARTIVSELSQKISSLGDLKSVQVEADTDSISAYEAYLEARELFLARNTINLSRSIALFEKAVDIDPKFARAWASLAAAYQIAPTWILLDRDYSILARTAAEKALALDPAQALPYAVLALGETESNPANYTKSFQYFKQALERDPKNTTVLLWRGISHVATGFFDYAKTDFERCLEIDSAYEICRRWLALAKLFDGETAEAFALFEIGAAKGERAHVEIFAKAYAAIGDERAAVLTWAWDLDGMQLDRGRFFRAYTDPDFEFDRESRAFEREYEVETGRKPNWGRIGGIGYAHTFKRYGDIEPYRFYPVWWLGMHGDFITSPERKKLIIRHGLLTYWHENGFPPRCRAVGADDFECT